MHTSIDHDDLDYIMDHLQTPSSLNDPEFQQWLNNRDHRLLFQEVRRNREAWLQYENLQQLDMEQEFKRYRKQMNRTQSIRLVSFRIAALAILVLTLSLFFFTNSKILLESPNHAEAVHSSGVQLIMEGGETIRLDQKDIQMENSNGVTIKNRANGQLAYTAHKSDNPKKLVYHTVRVPNGADYFLQLSDGTKVWLNCETTLRFPIDFTSDKREIYLEGEAFFDVTKAAQWPFIVTTNGMKVTVTGTRFNVQAYKNEPFIHTTLVTGAVTVNNRELYPTYQYRLNKTTGKDTISIIDTDLITGWIDGLFVFKGERLEEVMHTLARWYQIQLFFTGDDVKNIRFSGSLPRYESIETLLDMIRKIGKVDITKHGNTIILTTK